MHEALTSIERDDVPENSIIDIIQEGWKLNKDILRYTKVVISKKPKPPEPPKEEEKKEEGEKKERKKEKSENQDNKVNNDINTDNSLEE